MSDRLLNSGSSSGGLISSIPTPVWAFVAGLFVAGVPNFIPFIPFV